MCAVHHRVRSAGRRERLPSNIISIKRGRDSLTFSGVCPNRPFTVTLTLNDLPGSSSAGRPKAVEFTEYDGLLALADPPASRPPSQTWETAAAQPTSRHGRS